MIIKDEDIVELFFNVYKLNRRFSEIHFGNGNPYKGQYHCMFVLENFDFISQKDLAKLLNVRPTSVSELLVKLEQKGWISRKVSSTDKRISLVSLTDSGKEEVKRARKEKALIHSEMLSTLNVEEKESFYLVLEKIKKYYLEMEDKNE